MSKFDSKNFTDSVTLNLKNYFETVEDINKHKLNKIFGDVLSIIKQQIEINAPTIKLTRKQKRLARKPWLTKGILTSIKNKQKLYKSWFLKGGDFECKLYKKYNNCLTRVKNAAKNLF